MAGLAAVLLLVGGLLWQADPGALYNTLTAVPTHSLLAVGLLQGVTILLIVLQWWLIARKLQLPFTPGQAFHVNMAGVFVESITPAVKLGGEAGKILILRTYAGFDTARGAALVSVQKVFSLLPFMALTLCSLLCFSLVVPFSHSFISWLLPGLAMILVLTTILAWLVFFPGSFRTVSSYFPFLPGKHFRKKVDSWFCALQEALSPGVRDKGFLCSQGFLSLVIWLLFPVKAFYIAHSLGLEVGFFHLALATYLAYTAGMIPLLPGGLGTFEGTMLLMLIPAGVPLHQGLVFALIFRFITFWLVFLLSACYLGITMLVMKLNRRQAYS